MQTSGKSRVLDTVFGHKNTVLYRAWESLFDVLSLGHCVTMQQAHSCQIEAASTYNMFQNGINTNELKERESTVLLIQALAAEARSDESTMIAHHG